MYIVQLTFFLQKPQNCAYIWTEQKTWDDDECSTEKNFLCQTIPSSECQKAVLVHLLKFTYQDVHINRQYFSKLYVL